MIEHPHLDTYSIPARICLVIAVVGGAALIAMGVLTFISCTEGQMR
ncbi:hypothetical protein RAD16_12955 [Bradyrhizobium sp. 18BD]